MSDAVVVGGGIVGFGAAYRLACAGAEVTVVDRADTGRATDAGAGIVFPTSHFAPGTHAYDLAREALRYYPELVGLLEADGEERTGYETVGALHVALDEEESDLLTEVLRRAQEGAAGGLMNIGEVSRLDASEARGMFPALGEGVRGAVHLSGAARVNGRLLRDALERAARKRGAQVVGGAASLARRSGRKVAVEVDGSPLPAERVILAAGAWTRSLCEPIGLRVPVHPQRGQILHLDLPGTGCSSWPIVLGFRSHYILTFANDRVVAGATREDDSGYDPRVTADGAHEVLDEALRMAPGLGSGTLRDIRVGLRPATPDGDPVLGRASEFDNLFFATGHGRTGLLLGPYSGALVADLLLNRSVRVETAPFAADRFSPEGRRA